MNTSEKAVAEYQCPGCMNGTYPPDCPKYKASDEGCKNHMAGTFMLPFGRLALGLPKAFARFGPGSFDKDLYPGIKVFSSAKVLPDFFETIYSVVVWKYLDEHGNTICRAFSPRTNAGWSFVVEGDHRARWPNAYEVTEADMAFMD